VPYPVLWPDAEDITTQEAEHRWRRFMLFAGYVKGRAQEMGVDLRIGADWDGDFFTNDQSFHDAPHFELARHEVE